MTNPQKELYAILAESRLLAKSAKSRHQQFVRSIPDRQSALLQEINQLRDQIQSAGVGKDAAAEDRYLKLLEDLRYLDQSYEMGFQWTPEDNAEEMPEEMQKCCRYGRMLLSVYGEGALIKGASDDLQYWGDRLTVSRFAEARAIGQRLLELAGDRVAIPDL